MGLGHDTVSARDQSAVIPPAMSSVATSSSGQPSAFWTFSLGFYRQVGVPDACLELQDRCGVDVNIVLFLLWSATLRRRLEVSQTRALADRVRGWQNDVVMPIRNLRRLLKTPPPLLDQGTAELFRAKIKAVELESERLQQEAMFALAPSLHYEAADTVEDAARTNLRSYQSIMGRQLAIAAIETLVNALRLWAAGESP
jgi:uncharacterized protein (TIGR02444 family)